MLFYFWSGNGQPLARQQPFCVHDMVKALGTEATVQSLVPHLQVCPLSADRAVAESGVRCFANRIIHMARAFCSPDSCFGSFGSAFISEHKITEHFVCQYAQGALNDEIERVTRGDRVTTFAHGRTVSASGTKFSPDWAESWSSCRPQNRLSFTGGPALFFSELISDQRRINSNRIVMISSVNDRSGSAPRL